MGELILSRQVQRLTAQHNARSILMGTYAQGQDYVYVSARVVRAGDAMVLGSADFRLPLNNNTRSLLEGQGAGKQQKVTPTISTTAYTEFSGKFTVIGC
ncbi:hypothetical protein HORIV_21380 [Vreelandella olivaria]|uniref:FlgO domain-containing protein n=1 Tax=Vreelandella olivaria TaxID=390919 RepID=A0ABM7GGM9_9GAMM|nr:hypothetical protein HORIV_21380 [Halomonas olivaria]